MMTGDEMEAEAAASARGPGSMAEVVERVMRQRHAAQNAGGTTGVLIPFEEVDALLVAGAAASCLKDGVAIITAERIRQCASVGEGGEGWSPSHDDDHDGGELAMAAATYAGAAGRMAIEPHRLWPFDPKWWKGPDPVVAWGDESKGYTSRAQRIRALAKAGALCAAEIDRLRREEEREVWEERERVRLAEEKRAAAARAILVDLDAIDARLDEAERAGAQGSDQANLAMEEVKAMAAEIRVLRERAKAL